MPSDPITHLLGRWQDGDPGAERELMELVYPDLRRLAGSRLSDRGRITLEATDLVHEAYLRLGAQRSDWVSREQFFAIAARVMRRIVVDHLRSRSRQKRGGEAETVTLRTAALASGPRSVDLMALEHALEELAAIDGEAVRIVEMRFFAGMSTDEIAVALGTSLSTVSRRWRFARAWLERELRS